MCSECVRMDRGEAEPEPLPFVLARNNHMFEKSRVSFEVAPVSLADECLATIFKRAGDAQVMGSEAAAVRQVNSMLTPIVLRNMQIRSCRACARASVAAAFVALTLRVSPAGWPAQQSL